MASNTGFSVLSLFPLVKRGGGGGGGDVNVDNITLQKSNNTLSFKVKTASDKNKVWKVKTDGSWDLVNINEWKLVNTFDGEEGNTYTLYILTQDVTISGVKYVKGFYTWNEVDGFVLRLSDNEVFTDVGLNENLPTTDINDNTIYRKANYEYLHNGSELENEPVGYKILDTTNISVSSTGITIDDVETLWADLTGGIVESLITNDRLESAEFDEADFFNYDTTLYDIATNFEREIAYRLYHNPTKTTDGYIQIGGGSGGEILIDNETIVKNSDNELEAKAIISVGTGSLPTNNIKDAIYLKTEVVTYEDEEEVEHTFSMVKFFVRKNNAWDSMSKIELTEEQYSHLSQAQKEDGTLYIFEGTPQATLTYATLPDKPTINGIVVVGNLTLADLSLYSRNEIDSLLANKGTAEFVNEMPQTTQPLTWYYSKKFINGTDVPNDKRALYITDKDNVIHYMGIVGDIDLSEYYTKAQTDVELAKKQDKLTDSDETSNLTDNSKFSLVDSDSKTNKKWLLSKLWDYIKGKITEIYLPVGSVVLNKGTNPSTNFGGTWQLLTTGTKALYLDATAGTFVNEELPNIKGKIGSNGQWDTPSSRGGVEVARTGAFSSSEVNDGGRLQEGSSGTAYKTFNITFDASKSNSVYKNNGKVRAEGITICAWERTA